MGKDKSEAEIAAKKEKKEKKRKREETEDVDATTPKKEKKSKKRKSEGPAVDEDSVMDIDGQSLLKVEDADEKKDSKAVFAVPLSALVPFANPLADEKSQKKVLKAVKKGMQHTSYSEFCRDTDTSISRQTQVPQARRERMRQIHSQIPTLDTRLSLCLRLAQRHRHSRSRHLPHGRYFTHPRPVRGPQHSLHLRTIPRRARRRRKHQETHKCGHADAESGKEGKG